MKILHVCETLPGGPASYLDEILPYQAAHFGTENIAIVAPENHRSYIPKDFYGRQFLYPRSGRNSSSLWALSSVIKQAISVHKPDIVHLHSSFAGAVGRLCTLGLRRRPKIVFCAHCWSFDRTPKGALTRTWAFIERFLARWTDLTINISPHEEKLLADNGFSLERVVFVESGIDDLSTPMTRGREKTSTQLRLLYVGRMDRQKGFDLLMQEFEAIDPDRATLTVVGDKVVSRDAATHQYDHVEFLGWIPRNDVPALMQKYDAIIIPSRWEGMPLVAIEAFRNGCPVIASNRGPFPFIIEEGVNGFLIDIDTPGFVDSALTLLESADLPKMRVAARSTFLERFQAHRMNSQLMSAYETVALKTERRRVVPDAAKPDVAE